MRLIASLASAILLVPASWATAVTAKAYDAEHQESDKIAAKNLRGGTSPKKHQINFLSSDPLADFPRTGLDRSLTYIHTESEFNLPLSQEQLGAISSYITEYSEDGNDDNSGECPFDYEGDANDPFHPENYQAPEGASGLRAAPDSSGRALMGEMDMEQEMSHAHMHYVESHCNMMLDMANCTAWSTYFATNDLSAEVKIPCGECVTLDASEGEALYGSTLNFGEGLNVVGKLVVPNDANVNIVTKVRLFCF